MKILCIILLIPLLAFATDQEINHVEDTERLHFSDPNLTISALPLYEGTISIDMDGCKDGFEVEITNMKEITIRECGKDCTVITIRKEAQIDGTDNRKD